MGQLFEKSFLTEKISKNGIFEQFIQLQKINDDTFGEVIILQKKTNENLKIMLKEFVFSVKKYYFKCIEKIKERQKFIQQRKDLFHPNVIRLYDYFVTEQQLLCGSYYKISLFYEYSNESLQTQILNRRNQLMMNEKSQMDYFSELEIWNMLQQLINGQAFLQEQNRFCENIQPSTVMVFDQNVYKVFENQLDFKQISPQGSNEQCMQSYKEKYYSPYQFSTNSMEAKESKFKQNVFSLGITILNAMSLEPLFDIYDFAIFTVRQEKIALVINKLKQIYSENLINFIESMVAFDFQLRGDFCDLKLLLQKEMMKQTQTTQFNGQSLINNKSFIDSYQEILQSTNSHFQIPKSFEIKQKNQLNQQQNQTIYDNTYVFNNQHSEINQSYQPSERSQTNQLQFSFNNQQTNEDLENIVQNEKDKGDSSPEMNSTNNQEMLISIGIKSLRPILQQCGCPSLDDSQVEKKQEILKEIEELQKKKYILLQSPTTKFDSKVLQQIETILAPTLKSLQPQQPLTQQNKENNQIEQKNKNGQVNSIILERQQTTNNMITSGSTLYQIQSLSSVYTSKEMNKILNTNTNNQTLQSYIEQQDQSQFQQSPKSKKNTLLDLKLISPDLLRITEEEKETQSSNVLKTNSNEKSAIQLKFTDDFQLNSNLFKKFSYPTQLKQEILDQDPLYRNSKDFDTQEGEKQSLEQKDSKELFQPFLFNQ